ncbi:MAG: RnfABCDGE type electron transport complex subunit G [Bacteroidales bacterium]|nr:RnfABCDGE type electron transport complex subunit G [Bacteroidales bacterium]
MAKKESTFGSMLITLLIVTSIAALALGGVYNLTKEPIAAAKRAKLEKALSNVLPAFDSIQETKFVPENEKDTLYYYKATNAGEYVGTAVKTFTNTGFSGKIWIMVGIRPDMQIHNTAILEHKETPGLGDKMDQKKHPWAGQFIEKNPTMGYKLKVTKDGGDVDAITAATITSRAFCDAVKRAYDNLKTEGGNK